MICGERASTTTTTATDRDDERAMYSRNKLPGLHRRGVAVPTFIDVTGTPPSTTASSVGSCPAGDAVAGLELGGFTVTHLTLGGFVSSAASGITVGVGLRIGTGADAVDTEATLTLTGDAWEGSAVVHIDRVRLGAFELDDVTVTIDAAHTGVWNPRRR